MRERILLIEDQPRLQHLYEEELENFGFVVTATADSTDGINKLQTQPVDVVIVDLDSSANFALEYLQRIIAVARDVKVVLHNEDPATKSDFRSWIADAFLSQSPSSQSLKNTIDRVLHV